MTGGEETELARVYNNAKRTLPEIQVSATQPKDMILSNTIDLARTSITATPAKPLALAIRVRNFLRRFIK